MVTQEPWALPVTVAAGVAVDIDHGPDLWWTFALRRKPVAVAVFHGWEWLLGLVAFGVVAGYEWWLAALTVGYGLHLMTDHMFNGGHPWSQSFIFRARHRFSLERFAPERGSEHTYDVLRKEVPVAVYLIEWWRTRRSRREIDATQQEQ